MYPLQINTDMQFDLADLLTAIGFIGTLVGVYVTLRKSQVRADTIAEQHTERIKDLERSLKSETSKRDVDNRELWTKLVSIESSQSKTNVFLEENLKSINRLLEIHDSQIQQFHSKFAEQDKDVNEFYKTYELKKKD